MGGRRRPRPSDDRGQATVELALCLPLVVILVLAVVQLAVVVADMLQVHAASRDAARAAAASASPNSAAEAAGHAVLGTRPASIEVSSDGTSVTVRVRRVNHTDVPLVGLLLPDVTIEFATTMVAEPP